MGVNLGRNGEKVHFSSGYILRATQLLDALIFFLSCPFAQSLLISFFFFSLTPPIFLQVPWLLMVPQHASPLLWGHSALLHSSVTAFCSTKDVTVSCCVLQATSKEDAKIQGAEGARWMLLLLD